MFQEDSIVFLVKMLEKLSVSQHLPCVKAIAVRFFEYIHMHMNVISRSMCVYCYLFSSLFNYFYTIFFSFYFANLSFLQNSFYYENP